MCGIVGYVGNRNVVTVVLEGLKKLEYRGYDSAGIGLIDKGKTSIVKCKGRIADVEKVMQNN